MKQKWNGTDTCMELLSASIRTRFTDASVNQELLQEIRLRAGAPLMLWYDGKERGISGEGRLIEKAEKGYLVTGRDISETLEQITGYSLYAYDQELKQGFLTVAGGHRIGIAGEVVCENGKIQCVRHISGINIRLAHQKRDCAKRILPYLIREQEVCHTLILSPPGGGKTTMLRDLIRLISNGTQYAPGKKVGVIDERSELAGMYHGEAQNDLGIRTDVLDRCPKAAGLMMLLRAMSPQVIAVDELGSEQDLEAVKSVFYCGCRLIATAHGNSLGDIRRNPLLSELAKDNWFERYVLLGGSRKPGMVHRILDGNGEVLMKDGESKERDGTVWINCV